MTRTAEPRLTPAVTELVRPEFDLAAESSGSLRPPEADEAFLGPLGEVLPGEVLEIIRHLQDGGDGGAVLVDAAEFSFSPLGLIPTARKDMASVRGYTYDFKLLRVAFGGWSP
jgi:hypothetical protein